MAGKTNRKHKRNQPFCLKYKSEGREEKNKAKKLARHQKRHPNDTGQKAVPNYTRKRTKSPLDNYLSKNLDKI